MWSILPLLPFFKFIFNFPLFFEQNDSLAIPPVYPRGRPEENGLHLICRLTIEFGRQHKYGDIEGGWGHFLLKIWRGWAPEGLRRALPQNSGTPYLKTNFFGAKKGNCGVNHAVCDEFGLTGFYKTLPYFFTQFTEKWIGQCQNKYLPAFIPIFEGTSRLLPESFSKFIELLWKST